MRLFALGDTHLPSTRAKDMHRFGWTDHPAPLAAAWDATVRDGDLVVLVGDLSWATRPHEALGDLAWIHDRPGQKVLVRGNHDFWWGDSATRLRALLADFPSIVGFLHNCAVQVGPYLIAGSRLWTAPEAPRLPTGGALGDEPTDDRYVTRELRRLRASIADADRLERQATRPLVRIAAVHFPPLYANGRSTVFSDAVEAWSPKHCIYGHLHGPGIGAGFTGSRNGVDYALVSCDAVGFTPVLIAEADDATAKLPGVVAPE
ncbi:MAG TPA: metallophosphoesterase [Myxococcaceae bacterium]|nr:metallophosphoesterase [Myxococcaceae bacterium]